MTNFGGWLMPLQYTSIREEHRAVREAVGLFDLSHMGEVRLKDDAVAQRLLTRDLTALRTGRVQYALLCHDDGGIIDDVLVYAVADGGYLLVVNAGNQDSDFDWIRSHSPDGAVFNVGREWALVGVQGPRAVGLVQRLTPSALSGVKYYASWLSCVARRATAWGGQVGKRFVHARLQHRDGLCASCAYGTTDAARGRRPRERGTGGSGRPPFLQAASSQMRERGKRCQT